jgi:hypothetical protein
MGSHATNPDEHSHEGDAPGISGQANRDNYGWLNIHENHLTDVEVHNAHSLDAFDHRLSGCIYEGSGFTYSVDTYKQKWAVLYSETTLTPIWWHYFNAHVFSNGGKKAHKIAMANPTYEGLGYVNFIVTYVKQDIDTAISGYINTSAGLHTDLYTDASKITITLQAGTANEWYSTLGDISSGAAPWTENVAISSFPQNDLGKDFRFNIRILHKMGEADQVEAIDSYYWYKVNKVTITFPSTVGCHWDSMDDSNEGYFRCMDSASGPAIASPVFPNSGHMSWVSNDATHTDSTGRTFHESFPTATAVTGGGCSASYDEQKMSCGTVYVVEGLMNTYDEYAQQEYGTHQEFWFQFNYYYTFSPVLKNLCEDYEDFDCYQAPNYLFNAFEVSSVELECNTSNLRAHNGNSCAKTGSIAKSVETWS